MNKYNVDINAVLVKPLYMGLLINVFVPGILVLIAYLKSESIGAGTGISLSNMDMLFWVLLLVAVADGGVAIFLRQKFFMVPMIRSGVTFVDDITAGVFKASIICYALTASISVYGFVYFIISQRFDAFFIFVFISFIAFQLIRPRHGFLKKVIEAQEGHVDQGRFLVG